MTELEKIERAKMYMEKLANGIDPISDTAAPESDTINNVRLSRCFFYVAEVLGKVIDNGGFEERPYVYTPKKVMKDPFSLTAEQEQCFDFSFTPISASEISKRLSALVDTERMKKISASNIFSWLESIGALENEEYGNGNGRRVTETGREMGIISETKMSSYGNPYTAILFSREAQQLILDNTAAIVACISEQKEERKANKGAPWTHGDELLLIKLYEDGCTVRQISQTLKRTCEGVRKRMQKMGLVIKPSDE